jgi:uridine monophosphate synthetase
MNFFDWLEQRARQINSLLCVGLDPRCDSAAALRDACFRIIGTTADFALAFKPNSAFFEAFGPEGMAALKDVIAHVPHGIPVILDAKRGDIADTAEAYATAAFDVYGAHALTVNPYLGGEALTPFVARPDRGVFVLCKTSNPGADEFQALDVVGSRESGVGSQECGQLLFEAVAGRASRWTVHRNVGLVVGATDPQALARARAAAPNLWFLVPGVGAQGGDLEAVLEAALRPDGLGLLINVSRSIARAADPGTEAQRIRESISLVAHRLSQGGGKPRPYPRRAVHSTISWLAQDLIASQCVHFGQFKLKSGSMSPIYLDLRRLVTHPPILRRVAKAYAEVLRGLQFDRLAGIPYAALPIATAIALEMNRPLIYPRREAKDYGTQVPIEGDLVAGETVVVIDDLATTGGSKIEAIQKLESASLQVRDIVVLIDRGQGAGAMLAEAGYRLHAVVSLPELLEEWLRAGSITRAQYDEVKSFLAR